MRTGHGLRRLWAAGLLAVLATSTRTAALAVASVGAAAIAAAAAAIGPAAHAVHRHVPRALVGAWGTVRQQHVLPRWRGRCHVGHLRVRHGLHGLRAALQVAAALAAAPAAEDLRGHLHQPVREGRQAVHQQQPLPGWARRRRRRAVRSRHRLHGLWAAELRASLATSARAAALSAASVAAADLAAAAAAFVTSDPAANAVH